MITRRKFLGASASVLGSAALHVSFAEAAPARREPCTDPHMSYYVLDAETGAPLPGLMRNPDRPMLIASLTKVMTAMVVFNAVSRGKLSLNDNFAASAKAADEGGSRRIRLRAGEQHSVDDWLRLLSAISHNGAAVTLAEGTAARLSGKKENGEDAFVRHMNEMAEQLGLSHTRFYDPNGLHDKNVSTAREAATLLHKAIQSYPRQYAEYFGMKEYLGFKNHYEVLGHAGIDIVKSGYTRKARRCGVFSGERDAHRIVGAILNAPTGAHGDYNIKRDTETIWLAESAYARLEPRR